MAWHKNKRAPWRFFLPTCLKMISDTPRLCHGQHEGRRRSLHSMFDCNRWTFSPVRSSPRIHVPFRAPNLADPSPTTGFPYQDVAFTYVCSILDFRACGSQRAAWQGCLGPVAPWWNLHRVGLARVGFFFHAIVHVVAWVVDLTSWVAFVDRHSRDHCTVHTRSMPHVTAPQS